MNEFKERRKGGFCLCEQSDNTPWRKDREWIVEQVGKKMSMKIFGLLMSLFLALTFGAFGFSWATYARVSTLETVMVKTVAEVTQKMMERISVAEKQIYINKGKIDKD